MMMAWSTALPAYEWARRCGCSAEGHTLYRKRPHGVNATGSATVLLREPSRAALATPWRSPSWAQKADRDCSIIDVSELEDGVFAMYA